MTAARNGGPFWAQQQALAQQLLAQQAVQQQAALAGMLPGLAAQVVGTAPSEPVAALPTASGTAAPEARRERRVRAGTYSTRGLQGGYSTRG